MYATKANQDIFQVLRDASRITLDMSDFPVYLVDFIEKMSSQCGCTSSYFAYMLLPTVSALSGKCELVVHESFTLPNSIVVTVFGQPASGKSGPLKMVTFAIDTALRQMPPKHLAVMAGSCSSPGVMKALSENNGKGLLVVDEGSALIEACGLTADKVNVPSQGGALLRCLFDGNPLVHEVFKTEEKCQTVRNPRLSAVALCHTFQITPLVNTSVDINGNGQGDLPRWHIVPYGGTRRRLPTQYSEANSPIARVAPKALGNLMLHSSMSGYWMQVEASNAEASASPAKEGTAGAMPSGTSARYKSGLKTHKPMMKQSNFAKEMKVAEASASAPAADESSSEGEGDELSDNDEEAEEDNRDEAEAVSEEDGEPSIIRFILEPTQAYPLFSEFCNLVDSIVEKLAFSPTFAGFNALLGKVTGKLGRTAMCLHLLVENTQRTIADFSLEGDLQSLNVNVPEGMTASMAYFAGGHHGPLSKQITVETVKMAIAMIKYDIKVFFTVAGQPECGDLDMLRQSQVDVPSNSLDGYNQNPLAPKPLTSYTLISARQKGLSSLEVLCYSKGQFYISLQSLRGNSLNRTCIGEKISDEVRYSQLMDVTTEAVQAGILETPRYVQASEFRTDPTLKAEFFGDSNSNRAHPHHMSGYDALRKANLLFVQKKKPLVKTPEEVGNMSEDEKNDYYAEVVAATQIFERLGLNREAFCRAYYEPMERVSTTKAQKEAAEKQRCEDEIERLQILREISEVDNVINFEDFQAESEGAPAVPFSAGSPTKKRKSPETVVETLPPPAMATPQTTLQQSVEGMTGFCSSAASTVAGGSAASTVSAASAVSEVGAPDTLQTESDTDLETSVDRMEHGPPDSISPKQLFPGQ